ncbi:SGNH/GDSL hydrolase family protein [Dietzia sp. NPDC055340]
MFTSPSPRSARLLASGAAAVAVSALTVSMVAMAPTVAAAPPIPAAPPATGSTAEQFGGSSQTLGENIMGQVSSSDLGPAVTSGDGSGPARYVALGDSYAAVGRIAPGAWSAGPVTCVRTDDAYPNVVARELGVGTFVNASCGGAVTDDLWAPDKGVPAQFDALTEDTDLVSLSIGGNDVGFGAVLVACAVRTNTAAPFLPVIDAVTGPVAEDFDTTTGCADVIDRQATAALAELDTHLDEVYAEIARRSPDARVVTTGYLAAIPEDDATIASSPACEPLMAATRDERDKVRTFQNDLNDVVQAAAERNGATVVIPDEPGHSMCAPADTRRVDLLGVETGAAPVHPTTVGHAHVADRVLAALEA